MTGGRAEDNIQLHLLHPGDRRSGVHLLRSSLLVLMNSEECESVFSKYCVREGLLQLRNTILQMGSIYTQTHKQDRKAILGSEHFSLRMASIASSELSSSRTSVPPSHVPHVHLRENSNSGTPVLPEVFFIIENGF